MIFRFIALLKLFLFCFIFLLISFSRATTNLPEKKAIAVPTKTPPRIDGRVDKVWLQAPASTGFQQHSPDEGAPATNDTRIYVMFDYNNLYLLFVMLDRAPQSIPARLLERDQTFYPDDSINFLLDTYNDHRKAFYFCTNPLGVKQDGLVSENGEKVDMTWDGIFEVAAKKNSYGWIAEFAIPYSTLRFKENLRYQVWGFNVWRVRKASRELSYWALVSQNYRPFRLDKNGVLLGMRNISTGKNLNLLPYITARQVTQNGAAEDLTSKQGLDIKYGITSDLTLDLTLNPDFGQVEIDEEQINLDKRFEIYLEEKRPFFLENTNLFQFPFFQPFYSRRVGSQSDIKAGAKLSGKIGRYSLGFLQAATGDWDNYGLGDPDEGDTEELFTVLRVQQDILSSSNIGVVLVDREENLGGNSTGYNRTAGIDWSVYSGQKYFIGQNLFAQNSADDQQGFATFAQLGYYGSVFWVDLSAYYYDPDFEINGTGFFQNLVGKGHKQISLYSEAHPLINKRFVRSWGLSIQPTLIRESDETEDAWGIQTKAWIEAPDQSKFEIGVSRYKDIETDFFYSYAHRRAPLDQLAYWGLDVYAKLTTDTGKPISMSLRVNRDSQYYFHTHSHGFNQGFDANLRLQPISNSYLEVGYQVRKLLDREEHQIPVSVLFGQSDVQIWSLRSRYLFSNTVFMRGFLQYTNDALIFEPNSQSWRLGERISANWLMGWKFRPGSSAYLVYTEEFDRAPGSDYESVNRTLFFKFSYLWSF